MILWPTAIKICIWSLSTVSDTQLLKLCYFMYERYKAWFVRILSFVFSPEIAPNQEGEINILFFLFKTRLFQPLLSLCYWGKIWKASKSGLVTRGDNKVFRRLQFSAPTPVLLNDGIQRTSQLISWFCGTSKSEYGLGSLKSFPRYLAQCLSFRWLCWAVSFYDQQVI